VLPPLSKTESVRDLLLAVDISESMQTPDFVDPNGKRRERLDAVKLVLADFVARRAGDRVGLVGVRRRRAPAGALHARPRARPPAAGRGAGGDGGPAHDDRRRHRPRDQALRREPREAEGRGAADRRQRHRQQGAAAQGGEIAKSHGITIHTVGIGDPRTRGADLVDSGTLAAIAEATGGATFLALDQKQLDGIYRKLDEIEKVDLKTASYRPRRPLFHWPLGAAAVLLLAFYLATAGVHALAEARA
jgi:Ca-activated chloride channel family protein